MSGEAQSYLYLTSLAHLGIMQLLTFFNRHIQDIPQDSRLLWHFFQNALLDNLGYIWWPQFLKCNMLISVAETKAVSSSKWMFLRIKLLKSVRKPMGCSQKASFPSQHGQVTSECKAAQQSRMSKSHYTGTGCLAFEMLLCPCPLTTCSRSILIGTLSSTAHPH